MPCRCSAYDLGDAVKNVSGVVPQFDFGYREGFLIRGFPTRDTQGWDGFLIRDTRQSLDNIDRIEVFKGPAAILYGNIGPGGLVNLVSKRPQTERYYSLSQQFGSFATYRTLVDATGPLISDGALSYRLNFEYLDQGGFRDFVSINRKMVAPSFTWRRGRTQVDLDFIYQDEDNLIDNGIPALGNRPARIPRSRFLGESFAMTNTVNYIPALTMTHYLSDSWRVSARYQAQISDGFYTDVGQFNLNEATGDSDRWAFIGRFDQENHFGNLDLNGQFSTWGWGITCWSGRIITGTNTWRSIVFLMVRLLLPVLSIFSIPSTAPRLTNGSCHRRCPPLGLLAPARSGMAFIFRIRLPLRSNGICWRGSVMTVPGRPNSGTFR